MLKEVKDITTPGITRGLNTQYNILALQKDQSPNIMNVKVNYDGSFEKRLGSNTQNAIVISGVPSMGFFPDGTGTSSLVNEIGAWYNFDEQSGNRVSEFNNLTLTQRNSPLFDTGVRIRAVMFEASSKQTLYSASTSVYFSGSAHNLSLSGWVYLASTIGLTDVYPIISKKSVEDSLGDGGLVADASDSLVLNCDGVGTSFVDSSLSKKTVSPQGVIKQVNYKFSRTAGFFNGYTDYIIAPNSTDWNLGTGEFCIEGNFCFTTIQNCMLVDVGDGNNGTGVAIQYDGSNFYLDINGSYVVTAPKAVSTGDWFHLVAERSNGICSLYFNGVVIGSGASAYDIQAGSNGAWLGRGVQFGIYYSGWMKEVRISNISRYKKGFSIPTSKFSSDTATKLLVHFDNPATGPIQPAVYMAGTTDYVNIADSTQWDFGLNPFTLEGFVQFQHLGSSCLIDRDVAKDFGVYYTGDKLQMLIASTAIVSTAFVPSLGNWYHFAAVRANTGANGCTLYLNGSSLGTGTSDTNMGGSNNLVVGAKDTGAEALKGYLKEVRVSDIARYSAAFNPPLSIFSTDTNTILLLRFAETNGATTFFDSEMIPKTVVTSGGATIRYSEDHRTYFAQDNGNTGHKLLMVGSAKTDFFVAFGSGSAYLTPSADYLSVDNDTTLQMGAGDFTVEFMIRTAQQSAYQTIISKGYSFSGGLLIQTYNTAPSKVYVIENGATVTAETEGMFLNKWYHYAIVRSNTSHLLFQNGRLVNSSTSTAADLNHTGAVEIGSYSGTYGVKGLIDNVKISKGVARYTSTFDPSGGSLTSSSNAFEYTLYVNSSNMFQFDVSSSGIIAEGSVLATSYGALSTATWTHVVAQHQTGGYLELIVNGVYVNSSAYASNITDGRSQFTIGGVQGNTANYFDGRIDLVGIWNSYLNTGQVLNLYNSGTGNYYSSPFGSYPWASFDFGASDIRWLTCSAGTGVFASSNLGATWVAIATDRSATYQYMDRSKNVLVMTSDAYDNPIYWAGSAGTYSAIIGTSTPLCKYSINFQGFLILLNSKDRKRSFNYIDENLQLTSTGWLNFDMPSSADDEITEVFILRRYLYVSTRYKVFRVSYVGGNPDWQYVEVKNWGFVPRTARKIVISNQQQGTGFAYSIGEVVVGLSYDRKLKIFDGSGDQIISNNVEKDNKQCEFALDKISYFDSGPVISFAEVDPNQNVYKLCVAIGEDTENTTHFLNYDGRAQSLYPYSNMFFNCMCIAESANRQYLMAFDRSGYCHMMDSGNLDGNTSAIDDVFESPILFEKSPSQSTKSHKTDLFFDNTTSGTLYYEDRTDFSDHYSLRRKLRICGSCKKLIHYESIDVPEMYNTYQFRISSSSNTTAPWRMQRYDHFMAGLGIGRNE